MKFLYLQKYDNLHIENEQIMINLQNTIYKNKEMCFDASETTLKQSPHDVDVRKYTYV